MVFMAFFYNLYILYICVNKLARFWLCFCGPRSQRTFLQRSRLMFHLRQNAGAAGPSGNALAAGATKRSRLLFLLPQEPRNAPASLPDAFPAVAGVIKRSSKAPHVVIYTKYTKYTKYLKYIKYKLWKIDI